MKNTARLMFLFLCMAFGVAAQSDEEEIPRSTNESTMIGIGSYNLRDTYLSPSTNINYTGWMARILNDRMKVTKLADYKISRQQMINVEFGSTRNGAETANEYAGFVDYSLGYHYRFDRLPIAGLKVLTGASARLSGGFIYNTRNSNNPVSGKGDLDLNLSAMAIYGFKIKNFPLTLRYQMEMPLAGTLFSINRGQPYYFLSEGNTEGIIRFTSLHNKFAMKNYLTVDIPVAGFTIRTGYMNSMYRTDVNGIKTHVLSNAFMIGVVKEFISFGGKRLRNAHRHSSAYY